VADGAIGTVAVRGAVETVGARVRRHLREAGVAAVYGDEGAGLPVTAAAPAPLAAVLAAAHERVHRSPAMTWSGGVLSRGAPAASAWRADVDDRGELAEAVRTAAAGGFALRLDLDLAAPAGPLPTPYAAASATEPEIDSVLDRLWSARRPTVLAGPGVVVAGAIPDLRAFASVGRLGVLNTWGAKGILPWRSPHHWATVGLQADDFRLGGLADADLIVGVGIDPYEAPGERWQLAEHVVVEPAALGALAASWRRVVEHPPMPRLREVLSTATQRGWQVDTAPLPPSRVTLAYGAVAARGGLVAADPGTAGFWVARTVGTMVPDTVVVPGAPASAGFAVACALVARIVNPARAVLAVADGPLSELGLRLLELADELGLPVPVEVWSPDGPRLDAAAHAARLDAALYAERRQVLPLATDPGRIAEMVAAAGPVIAWQGRSRVT
jgi:hypothetical protein